MVGQQIQLAATITGGTGPVAWSSENAAVATVNSTGLVTALTLGQVTITATSGSASGTAALTTTTGIVFESVSAGSNHTCGVTLSGVAYCWGSNSSGQLGNGTTTNSPTPVPVSGGLSFASVSAGGNQTCGVISFDLVSELGGVVYCWGDNSSGQLGNGSTTNSAVPILVQGGLLFKGLQFPSVSVGGKHVCGENGGSFAYCWGDNSFGQLGNGTMTNSTIPVAVVAVGSDGQQISAGSTHTCSIQLSPGFNQPGPAACWGDNSSGQFGNGTTTSSNVPVSTFWSENPGILSAGTLYTCTTDLNGGAVCSGNNTYGQLGNGSTTNSSSPVAISTLLTFRPVPLLSHLYAMSAGGDHACTLIQSDLDDSQSANCWGNNGSGQLGNGTTSISTTVVPVSGGLSFAVISAGGSHTCAVTSSVPSSRTAGGAVYCWGDNTYGQLGNNWTMSSSVPVNVAGTP